MKTAVLFLVAFVSFGGVSLGAAPPLEELKSEARSLVDAKRTFTQQMVDEIFSFSELGFQEVETSAYLTGILEKNLAFRSLAEWQACRRRSSHNGDRAKPVIGFIGRYRLVSPRDFAEAWAWLITIR